MFLFALLCRCGFGCFIPIWQGLGHAAVYSETMGPCMMLLGIVPWGLSMKNYVLHWFLF